MVCGSLDRIVISHYATPKLTAYMLHYYHNYMKVHYFTIDPPTALLESVLKRHYDAAVIFLSGLI